MGNNYFLNYLINEDKEGDFNDYDYDNQKDAVAKTNTHKKEQVIKWFFKVLREIAILGQAAKPNAETTIYVDFKQKNITKKIVYNGDGKNSEMSMEVRIDPNYTDEFYAAVTKVFSHYKSFGFRAGSKNSEPPQQASYALVPVNPSEYETVKGVYQFQSEDVTYRDNGYINTERDGN